MICFMFSMCFCLLCTVPLFLFESCLCLCLPPLIGLLLFVFICSVFNPWIVCLIISSVGHCSLKNSICHRAIVSRSLSWLFWPLYYLIYLTMPVIRLSVCSLTLAMYYDHDSCTPNNSLFANILLILHTCFLPPSTVRQKGKSRNVEYADYHILTKF